jgi:cellulose synthase/poly-beta-1,6-N-acetylglucosamine synthase-like glycosyltransferase
MTYLFWSLLGLVLFVYAGYPLVLLLLRALRGERPIAYGETEPKVTVIISAYNEAEVIAAKLENALALDYPREKLQILVVSDASSDGTDAVVSGFASRGVELLRTERGGKTAGLNAAVPRARGEILVFSDANAMYGTDVIRTLVRNFADPRVGAAVGESTYVELKVAAERTEGAYWRYEVAIKRLESAIGSVVGGDGAIYAIRACLYQPMHVDAISDFVNPLQIVRAGYRCIYESRARSYERAADSFDKEFRRKVRIVNRAWRGLFMMKSLLNPLRYGLFSFELVSHKLLRWLVPVFLAGLLLTNLALLDEGWIYRLAMAVQAAFYLLALIGYAARRSKGIPSLISIPYFFCLANIASAAGIIDALRGKRYTTWNTIRVPNRSP